MLNRYLQTITSIQPLQINLNKFIVTSFIAVFVHQQATASYQFGDSTTTFAYQQATTSYQSGNSAEDAPSTHGNIPLSNFIAIDLHDEEATLTQTYYSTDEIDTLHSYVGSTLCGTVIFVGGFTLFIYLYLSS